MARQTFFERRTAERKEILDAMRNLKTLLELEQLKDLFSERVKAQLNTFEKIRRLLPFNTEIRYGNTYAHIMNKGATPVELEFNGTTIHEHDTLCRKSSMLYHKPLGLFPECPGCLAIGAGLAVREKE